MPKTWAIGGSRPAPGRGRHARPRGARAVAPRRSEERTAAPGDPAPLLPDAGARPGPRAQHGRRGVRAARGGGLARGPAGRRHEGRASPRERPAGAQRTAATARAAVRPAARRAPISPPSRETRGSPRLAGRCARRRPTRSATETHAVASSSAARWPSTSPGHAESPPHPSGSSSAPVSSRDCPW